MTTCPKIKSEKYENAHSIPLVNLAFEDPELGKLLSNVLLENLSSDSNIWISLYGDHRDKFKEVWGPQSTTWTGYSRHWIWYHSLKHIDVYVLSGVTGTTYEVTFHNGRITPKALKEVRTFLSKVIQILRT